MKNIREFHDRINKVFHISLALPLLPMGFLYLESQHDGWEGQLQSNQLVIYACFAAAVLLLAFVMTNFKNNVLQIRELDSTKEKFERLFPVYRQLYLGGLGVALTLTIGYYFTGAGLLIGAYVFQLFGLSIMRPYPDRYVRDLHLPKKEAKLVRSKELQF